MQVTSGDCLKQTDLVTISSNRAATYLFLSKVYERELTRDQIAEMRTKARALFNPHSADDLGNPDMRNGVELLTKSVSAMEGRDLKEVETELAAEYAGIFLGVRQIVPHPSESVYAGSERLVMQRQRDEVLEMYRQMGLDKVSEFTEPEDHIAVELSFMAHLARETATALESKKVPEAKRYTELQKRFLSEHLARWTPKLCDDIQRAAKLDFYRGIAMVTRGFVSMDFSMLDDFLEELRGTVQQGRENVP